MTIVHVDHQIDSKEIARRVWEKDHAEVDLSTLTLEQLAECANREHDLTEKALLEAMAHAFRVGDALLAARASVGHSGWANWVRENLDFSLAWASAYMRSAFYRSEVIAGGATSVTESREVLKGLPAIYGTAPDRYLALKDEARAMHRRGVDIPEISERLGIAPTTARVYVDPTYARKQREWQKASTRRLTEARKALAEKHEREDRDRLARERGGNLGKAYDQVRKLQPVIDAAMAEGLSVEARALAVRLEDEIFKALKS